MKIQVTTVHEYEVDKSVMDDYIADELSPKEILEAEKDAITSGDIDLDNDAKVISIDLEEV